MENNVVTLETAKKLKAAKFPQETYFVWVERFPLFGDKDQVTTWTQYKAIHAASNLSDSAKDLIKVHAAPTAQEVMNELVSDRRSSDLTFRPFNEDDKSWLLEADGQRFTYYVEDDNNIAELVAGAWLKLHESQGGTER